MNEITIEQFKSRDEILFAPETPLFSSYEKAVLLKKWDDAHKGKPPERPGVLPAERVILAGWAEALRRLRTAHVELAADAEKFRNQLEKSRANVKQIEINLLQRPDHDEDVQALVFARAKSEALAVFVTNAPRRLGEIGTAARDILERLDRVLSRRFGNAQPGGRFGGGALASQIDAAIREIESALNR
jgi:hypothetical protein